jgi:hypothetical protein
VPTLALHTDIYSSNPGCLHSPLLTKIAVANFRQSALIPDGNFFSTSVGPGCLARELHVGIYSSIHGLSTALHVDLADPVSYPQLYTIIILEFTERRLGKNICSGTFRDDGDER